MKRREALAGLGAFFASVGMTGKAGFSEAPSAEAMAELDLVQKLQHLDSFMEEAESLSDELFQSMAPPAEPLQAAIPEIIQTETQNLSLPFPRPRPLHAPTSLVSDTPYQPFPMPRLIRRSSEVNFYHIHTGETLRVDFGNVNHDAFNYFMRDFRNGEVKEIDPRLINRFGRIIEKLRSGGETVTSAELISGYRSPETNRRLQETRGGQATNSQHLYGRAMDLRVPGVALRLVHRAAVNVSDTEHNGGVGYYPSSSSNFVHIDTARRRDW